MEPYVCAQYCVRLRGLVEFVSQMNEDRAINFRPRYIAGDVEERLYLLLSDTCVRGNLEDDLNSRAMGHWCADLGHPSRRRFYGFPPPIQFHDTFVTNLLFFIIFSFMFCSFRLPHFSILISSATMAHSQAIRVLRTSSQYAAAAWF
jgi:hypothetical protein